MVSHEAESTPATILFYHNLEILVQICYNISMETITKQCKGCEIEKPLDLFYKEKRGKFGRRSKCKECTDSSSRSYRARNIERITQKEKEYKERNAEHIKEYNRERHKRVYVPVPRNEELNPNSTTLVCITCKIEKSLSDFHKRKLGKYGVQRHCKECRSSYYKRNLTKEQKKKRQQNTYRWKKDNPEKVKEYSQKEKNHQKLGSIPNSATINSFF